MTASDPPRIRPARRDDAPLLAKFIDIAGEGIPSHLWRDMAREGESVLQVGAERARRVQGGFSYRNALVAEYGGVVAGMLLGYALAQPAQTDAAATAALPPMLRPMLELEQAAAGTWYVNALAVRPGLRGRGIGSALMLAAETAAAASGEDVLSVQVFSQNEEAVRFYLRHGFEQVDERKVLEHPCQPYYDDRILLMLRRL